MMISQMEPWFGEEEATAVCDYMRSGGWLMEFRKTREFESMIAAFTGAPHCIVTNNGTISLTLAALACGVRGGDDVMFRTTRWSHLPIPCTCSAQIRSLWTWSLKPSASISKRPKRR